MAMELSTENDNVDHKLESLECDSAILDEQSLQKRQHSIVNMLLQMEKKTEILKFKLHFEKERNDGLFDRLDKATENSDGLKPFYFTITPDDVDDLKFQTHKMFCVNATTAFEANDFQAAIKYLLEALANNPSDNFRFNVHYNLSFAYHRTGEWKLADVFLRSAVDDGKRLLTSNPAKYTSLYIGALRKLLELNSKINRSRSATAKLLEHNVDQLRNQLKELQIAGDF